jgi:Uncharacterised nucleotidyltransferase
MEIDWRWYLIQYKSQEHKIVKTFELFRKYHIEPVLIKGWAAARFYPRREERLCLDIDVCVAPDEFERAVEVSVEGRREGLIIDLHNGLRHLDTLEWDDLFENTELIKLDETSIRVLRPEDHLRVLCVHWLNDGAAYKARLWDIYYAVENRQPDFDWNRCLMTVDAKRRKYIFCAVKLARLYLGLELKNTPFADDTEHIPKWVIKTVEKEWADENRLKRLQDCLSDRKELFRQLKKRIPPNAIQATVEMDGEFDEKSRIFYQLGDIFLRLKPYLKKFAVKFR